MSDTSFKAMSIVAISVLALSGCSKPASDNAGSAGSPAATAVTSPSASSNNAEPAWATAAGPSYTSSVLHAGVAVTDHVYQIDTADDYETVASWYKSHMKANWSEDSDGRIVANVGGVEVSVEKNHYWHDASQPKTTIGFFRKG